MSKYIVIRDNYGFKGRYWTEGEIVDLDKGEIPPNHFEILKDSYVEPVQVVEKIAFSQLNTESNVPKTGMAFDPSKEPKKRGKSK